MSGKPHSYINIGNITIVSLLAITLYFITGSLLLYWKEKFYNIWTYAAWIQISYFLMVAVMLLCSMILFLCGILLWKYDEKP